MLYWNLFIEALFREQLGVENTLYILIFGEAVLNDAAAIVINRTFVALSRENKGDNKIAPAAAMYLLKFTF